MPRKKTDTTVIQERDHHLLRELSVMRVIDREQAKIICGFGSISRVNRRLLALTQAKLLKRIFMGGPAWKKSFYFLSSLGAKLVGTDHVLRRRNNEFVTSDYFLPHQLAINSVYCAAKYRPHPPEGISVIRHDSFYLPIDAHRSLIPDRYLEFSIPEGTLPAFLEVDLGNESLRTWRSKVEKYLRYAISHDFERTFGHPAFRVLAVTNSEGRTRALRRATLEVTNKLFWFTTLDAIRWSGFWSRIWLRPGAREGEPLPLVSSVADRRT